MSDEWRLEVNLQNEHAARELAKRLQEFDREHDLSTSFDDRVVVSRDDSQVFAYTSTRGQAEATERAIRALAGEHGWQVGAELKRWHPVAEEWEDPDKPLPQTRTELAAERAEVIEEEREESAEQGYPEFEVKIKCHSHRDARKLAEKLTEEGLPNVHRWQFVVLGATDEDSANALAERMRGEAPPGSVVTAEGSASEIVDEAPYATPFGPFAVFGGL